MPALKPKVKHCGLQDLGWVAGTADDLLPGPSSLSFMCGPSTQLDLTPRRNENCTYPLAPWQQLSLSCYLGLSREPGDRSEGVGPNSLFKALCPHTQRNQCITCPVSALSFSASPPSLDYPPSLFTAVGPTRSSSHLILP